jgi:hypothetical protein
VKGLFSGAWLLESCSAQTVPQKAMIRCFIVIDGHISHATSSTVLGFSTTPRVCPAFVIALPNALLLLGGGGVGLPPLGIAAATHSAMR